MSNILKDAMIDAKAVRATALANARSALSEAFSPKLEAMFSQKLKELEEPAVGDDTGLDVGGEMDAAPVDAPMDDPVGDEMASMPDQSDEFSMDQEVPQDAPELDVSDEAPIQESEDVALKGAPSGCKTEDKVGVNGQTKQAFKKDDKNVTAPLSGSNKANPKSALAGEKTEDKVGVNGQTKQAVKKDDRNFTTPLKENDSACATGEESELDAILKELDSGEDLDIGTSDESGSGEEENPFLKEASDEDEEIDLDEVFGSLKESDDNDEDDKDEEKDEVKEKLDEANKALVKENNEYKRALSYLKTKLNEINLLNAKLLYTNKLFKAADLSNNQKMKIVENMDLAKTVREVKFAYALLTESNFGGKQPVKEVTTTAKKVLVPNKTVSTITEGLASKAVASTKPSKELLTEGAVMANRFRKLAGIKNKA